MICISVGGGRCSFFQGSAGHCSGRETYGSRSALFYKIIILITFNLHTAEQPQAAPRVLTTPVLFCNVFAISNKIPHKSYNFRHYHGYYEEAPQSSYHCNGAVDAQILDNYE